MHVWIITSDSAKARKDLTVRSNVQSLGSRPDVDNRARRISGERTLKFLSTDNYVVK